MERKAKQKEKLKRLRKEHLSGKWKAKRKVRYPAATICVISAGAIYIASFPRGGGGGGREGLGTRLGWCYIVYIHVHESW